MIIIICPFKWSDNFIVVLEDLFVCAFLERITVCYIQARHIASVRVIFVVEA